MFLAPLAQGLAKAGPLISAGLQIAGGITQARGQQQAYEGTADTKNYNQAVLEQQAGAIERAGAQEKETALRRKRAQLSAMQASVGARGLQLSGSPLLLMAESAAELELDVQNQEYNSLVEANQARSQAAIYGIEAENYRKAGKTAVRNTGISTAFKILSQY